VAGLELTGEVLALGADVIGFAIGDRVMAMASGASAILDRLLHHS
jgi:NADPH:quinone reductase